MTKQRLTTEAECLDGHQKMSRTDHPPTSQLQCSVSSVISYNSYCSAQRIIITAVQKHKSLINGSWNVQHLTNGSSVSHCQDVVIQLCQLEFNCQSGNSIHKMLHRLIVGCVNYKWWKKAQHPLSALSVITITTNDHWNSTAAHFTHEFFNTVRK